MALEGAYETTDPLGHKIHYTQDYLGRTIAGD
jgi:hypothetical protein